MNLVPSPAELHWRIGWLTGTATPPPPLSAEEQAAERWDREVQDLAGFFAVEHARRRVTLRSVASQVVAAEAARVRDAAVREVGRQFDRHAV